MANLVFAYYRHSYWYGFLNCFFFLEIIFTSCLSDFILVVRSVLRALCVRDLFLVHEQRPLIPKVEKNPWKIFCHSFEIWKIPVRPCSLTLEPKVYNNKKHYGVEVTGEHQGKERRHSAEFIIMLVYYIWLDRDYMNLWATILQFWNNV